MHDVISDGLQLPGVNDAVCNRHAAFDPIGDGDAHESWLVLRPCGVHGTCYFEGEAHPVVEAAAILIAALVGNWRQELVQQIAVRRVNFDHVEARRISPLRSGYETCAHASKARVIERHGHGV